MRAQVAWFRARGLISGTPAELTAFSPLRFLIPQLGVSPVLIRLYSLSHKQSKKRRPKTGGKRVAMGPSRLASCSSRCNEKDSATKRVGSMGPSRLSSCSSGCYDKDSATLADPPSMCHDKDSATLAGPPSADPPSVCYDKDSATLAGPPSVCYDKDSATLADPPSVCYDKDSATLAEPPSVCYDKDSATLADPPSVCYNKDSATLADPPSVCYDKDSATLADPPSVCYDKDSATLADPPSVCYDKDSATLADPPSVCYDRDYANVLPSSPETILLLPATPATAPVAATPATPSTTPAAETPATATPATTTPATPATSALATTTPVAPTPATTPVAATPRIPQVADNMVDHHGHRSTGLRTPAQKRGIPTLPSSLLDPTPSNAAPTMPAVKALAPETAEVDPANPGGDHIAHGQLRDGLPPKLPQAESVPAVSINRLGLAVPPPWYRLGLAVPPPWYRLMKQLWSSLAVPPPWYRLMKQLWSSLDPWPNAEQQDKFIIYKMEKMYMIMKMVCLLQLFGQMGIALRNGFCLLSLSAIIMACVFSMPAILALHKRDYLLIEKLVFTWCPMRKLFSYHLHVTSPTINYMMPVLFVRLARAVAEPIRFQWALAENLGMLVLNYILPNGLSLSWILFCHVFGLHITAVQEIRYRKQYLALEKSQ
eukprot:gene6890-30865_t